jgi:pimeloyl-ACP methyl ester carboxylesterase
VRTLTRAALIATLVLTQGLLAGCLAPAVRAYQQTAAGQGLVAQQVEGRPFAHRVYLNDAAAAGSPGRLNVYLDGDGIPWRGYAQPALEPTARDPLVLRLMSLDPGPAVYLGRPCYLGVYDPARCTPWHWTHGRYSETVVDSMVQALHRIIDRHRVHDLTLIGYSGGGALAMLIAPRLVAVSGVITLAANLDLQAWVDHHGYSPLSGSQDPARQPPLPARVAQWHWVGGDDRAVPPAVVENGLAHQPDAHFEVIPAIDHACCWEAHWPRLLEIAAQPSHATRPGSTDRAVPQ